jgi:hypothetical protein
MDDARIYEVLLLPRQEVAGRFGSLTEADAWMRSYNAVAGELPRAVVAERRLPLAARRRRKQASIGVYAARRTDRGAH